jgi:integrase
MKLTLKAMFDQLNVDDWATTRSRGQLMQRAGDVMLFFGAGKTLGSISYPDVMAFIAHLKKEGKSGDYINHRLNVLSKAFTMGRRFNPHLLKPEMPRQKGGKARDRVLTDTELEAIVSWDGWPEKYLAVMMVVADTGIRPIEVLSGKYELDGKYLILRDTKNGEDRTIVLTPRAIEAIAVVKSSHVQYRMFYHYFKKASDACGFDDKVVPYTLRHSALTKLAENTDNVLLIQKWAGHRSLATTQRYVKATRKGLDKLGDILASRK